MTQFCAIAPTAFLDEFAEGRPAHLLLAHLVEESSEYRNWYINHKNRYPESTYILDNSCFERYKAGLPMYESGKLIELAKTVDADYAVLSDYPAEAGIKTIEAAQQLAPEFLNADIGTFFCPQSKIGELDDLIATFKWATSDQGNRLIDYIGLSILAIPNAFGVERSSQLQRYCSRARFMDMLQDAGVLYEASLNGQKMHCLGMLDGYREIDLLRPWLNYIDTWDSSSPVWAGLNGIAYDTSPTGLINGKFELEVDFSMSTDEVHPSKVLLAHNNLDKIDTLLAKYVL